MIYAIILSILVLVVKLIYDYRLWLKKKPVNHTKEWLIMAIGSIPAIVIFTLESKLPTFFSAPLSAIMLMGFIWFFFDGLYNILRGQNWFYTGTDDKDDAASDNFLQMFSKPAIILFKVAALIPILVYILTK